MTAEQRQSVALKPQAPIILQSPDVSSPKATQLYAEVAPLGDPEAIAEKIRTFIGQSLNAPHQTFLEANSQAADKYIHYKISIQGEFVLELSKLTSLNDAARTEAWRKLSPSLREVMTRYFIFLELSNDLKAFADSSSQVSDLSIILKRIDAVEQPIAGRGSYLYIQVAPGCTIQQVLQTISTMNSHIEITQSDQPINTLLPNIPEAINLKRAVQAVATRQLAVLQEKVKQDALSYFDSFLRTNPWASQRVETDQRLSQENFTWLMRSIRSVRGADSPYLTHLPQALATLGFIDQSWIAANPQNIEKPSKQPKGRMFGRIAEALLPTNLKENVKDSKSITELLALLEQEEVLTQLQRRDVDTQQLKMAIKEMRRYYQVERTTLPIGAGVSRDKVTVRDFQKFGITNQFGIATQVLELLKARSF